MDGSGYPDRLVGTEIPMFARIAGIVDTYDTLIGPKKHAEARSSFESLVEIQDHTPDQFQPTEEFAYRNLYRGRGGQATEDLSVTVLQGRCVGGSSTVNWLTCLRTPEFVLDAWQRKHGVAGMTLRELEPFFERIETYLHVRPEPDANHSPNNRIILEGGRRLGWRTHPLVIDKHASTTLEGVYACGEIAGGTHGRNRMMGNSLLECVVFGRRAGRAAAEVPRA